MFGIGFSLGNVYDLWDRLQLVYGGSLGWWMLHTGHYEYKGHRGDYNAQDYLASFVKLRWNNYVELTYRGLLGYKEVKYYDGNEDITRFGWNNHQLMLGLYFATSRRDR
jgi:hypothetical protein